MSQAGELSGRVALVTGGVGGVGRAVVELLARRGALVYLNCFHSYPAAKETAERLTAEGLDVRLARGSVAKADQVRAIIEEIRRSSGRLDMLVNNAALGIYGSAEDLTDEDLDQAFAVNLKGPLRCVREARPLLAATGGGTVVNVSSIGSTAVVRDYLAIGVSKAALEAMTRYLAVELAPDGIRVNTASSGLLDTKGGNMFPAFDAMSSAMSGRTPLQRIGTVAELAELVAFLASARSSWITGQVIIADGGLGLIRGDVPLSPAAPPGDAAARSPATEDADRVAAGPEGDRPEATRAPDEPDADDPVVVVGMGLALPGASSPQEFWEVLEHGPNLFVEAAPDRWTTDAFAPGLRDVPDKGYQPASGLITDFRPHPALAAEGAANLAAMDFSTLWLRHSLYQAMEQTSHSMADRFHFCVGLTADGSQHLAESQVIAAVREAVRGDAGRELSDTEKETVERLVSLRFPRGAVDASRSLPHSIAADAIRGILPDDTPVRVLDTACSSSLYALERGVRELRAGRCDIAVTGGGVVMQITNMVAFAKLGGLSPTRQVRSMDENADGTLFADGAGLVVLKRLSRALADGDRIFGVVRGIGLSADGKGKAINAPATRGQTDAARKALVRSGVPASAIDLVVAHATGTSAGDTAELLGIGEVYTRDHPVTVVSNKSVIGHTGWPAGTVSLIHLLLCLEHDKIPPQHRFTRLPPHIAEQAPLISVPVEPLHWLPAPDPERPSRTLPRIGAVAAFGFGGTNATAIVSEYVPGATQPSADPIPPPEPLVIVGWSAKEPDDDKFTFGEVYPIPSYQQVSLPPPMMRRIDRGQLLAIECMQLLPGSVQEFCQKHRESTGVLFGSMGQTHAMSAAQSRVHFDDVRHSLGDNPTEGMLRFLDHLRRGVEVWPEISADTQPGEMPNIVASRISNYFDIRGLNMVVDGGEASLLQAFEAAARYLETDDLELALVGGVSANPHPAWAASIRSAQAVQNTSGIREGAYLFAVTKQSTARAAGLPVLAHVEC